MKRVTEYRVFNIATDEGLKLHGRLPYNTESLDLGGFKETINPSAFKKTLKEREVKLLLNHNRENLLARTNNGSLRVYDTGDAIEWDATLVDIPENQALWEKIKSGLYSQISFGFRCIRDRWSNNGKSRELLECALEEFSIVDDAAYGASATVSCRSLSEALKDAEMTDENKAEVEAEIAKLQSLLNPEQPQQEVPAEPEAEDIKEEPAADPEPEKAAEDPKEEPAPEEPATPAEETVLKSEYDALLKEYEEAISSYKEQFDALKEECKL